MPTPERFRSGDPCWIDLHTSDVDAARAFYTGVLGWAVGEADETFGGYFMFLKEGVPVAGAVGLEPGSAASASWRTYFSVVDIDATMARAEAHESSVLTPATPVGDLGTMATLSDPGGATFGLWSPGSFPGFGVVNEDGTARWFELHTRHFHHCVSFYESVLGWTTKEMGDTDEFRYRTANHGESAFAGIFDSPSFLADDDPPLWLIYFGVPDTDAAVAAAVRLGGSVISEPADTPFGRIATIADPSGAQLCVMKD